METQQQRNDGQQSGKAHKKAERGVRPNGAMIRQLRRERGWSQGKLASEAGITKNTVIRIESGREEVHLQTLLQVAETLGISFAPF